MNGMAIVALAAALGVDVGWRPADSGGLEYIIQIEPQLVGSLLGGQAIASDVPPALRPLATLRVRVGRGTLPRELPERSSEAAAGETKTDEEAAAAAPPAGTAVGWQPIEGGGLEYLIQIEPDAVDALSDGEELRFDLRAAPGEVSSLRITVGKETLPQIAPAAEQGTETIATDDAEPADESQPVDEAESAGKMPATADSSQVASDSAEPRAEEPAGSQTPAAAGATRHVRGADPTRLAEPVPPSADEPPALSDDEARQAADAANDSPQPRQALRPEEKPPGRFVPDHDSQPIAARGDAESGEADGERGGTAFVSTGGTKESGVQQSGDDGNNGIATPSPSAEGADKPEKSAAAPDPWWASRTTTVLGLGGSLGANAYLIWLFWGLRRRYRDLLDQLALRPAV